MTSHGRQKILKKLKKQCRQTLAVSSPAGRHGVSFVLVQVCSWWLSIAHYFTALCLCLFGRLFRFTRFGFGSCERKIKIMLPSTAPCSASQNSFDSGPSVT